MYNNVGNRQHLQQIIIYKELGYEQAGLTLHPPPPRMIEGGFIFSHGCLVPPIFLLKIS